MKALTIHQPFAWATGHDRPDLDRKNYEIRGEATNYRGPVVIHAARRPPLNAYEINRAAVATMGGAELGAALPDYQDIKCSGFLAIARVTGCEFVTNVGDQPKSTLIKIGREVKDLTCDGWRVLGSYAWRLEDIMAMPFVRYPNGFLGFWTIDPVLMPNARHRDDYMAAWSAYEAMPTGQMVPTLMPREREVLASLSTPPAPGTACVHGARRIADRLVLWGLADRAGAWTLYHRTEKGTALLGEGATP